MGKGIHTEKKLSEQLAAVIGPEDTSRPQVVKKMWVYIKANNLQNPDNKRNILCDEKLKALFGKDEITMFEMNKLLSAHLS